MFQVQNRAVFPAGLLSTCIARFDESDRIWALEFLAAISILQPAPDPVSIRATEFQFHIYYFEKKLSENQMLVFIMFLIKHLRQR